MNFSNLINVLENGESDISQITEQINKLREVIRTSKCAYEAKEYCKVLDYLVSDFISKKYNNENNPRVLKLTSER